MCLYLIWQDIQEAHAGQIVAVFGVDCASGKVPIMYLTWFLVYFYAFF